MLSCLECVIRPQLEVVSTAKISTADDVKTLLQKRFPETNTDIFKSLVLYELAHREFTTGPILKFEIYSSPNNSTCVNINLCH